MNECDQVDADRFDDEITSLRQQVETLTQELQALKEDARWRNHWHKRLGRGITESEGQLYKRLASLAAAQERMTAEKQALWEALKMLRIDANRLCDRNLGGTYEDDCRRAIKAADEALYPAALPSLAASSRETTNETKD